MAKQNNNTPARTFAIQFLYQIFLKENQSLKESFEHGEFNEDQFEQSLTEFVSTYREPDNEHPDSNISQSQLDQARALLNSLKSNYQDVSQQLAGSIKSNLENLNPFDHAALLVGITEINYHKTPFEIVTNELVIISKKYGSESSSKFINGVLDGIGRAKHS